MKERVVKTMAARAKPGEAKHRQQAEDEIGQLPQDVQEMMLRHGGTAIAEKEQMSAEVLKMVLKGACGFLITKRRQGGQYHTFGYRVILFRYRVREGAITFDLLEMREEKAVKLTWPHHPLPVFARCPTLWRPRAAWA